MTGPVVSEQMLAEPRIHRLVIVGSFGLFAAMIASVWGEWSSIAGLLVIQSLRVSAIAYTNRRMRDRRALTWVTISLFLNLGFNVAVACVAGWPLVYLLYLPFQLLVAETYAIRFRWAIHPIVVGQAGLALVAGLPALAIGSMLILAYVTWAITKTRTEVLDRAHAALIAKHEELGAAYTKLHAMRTKLFEQEKLAAIGVLAAGVAHEINNPMTFVTANLQSMAEDLRELAGDPELLREYAEEVLPATLDGVQRVNTIVADILRFARTTPEEPELYDLCSQIETALRISQSRTKHCVIRMGTCASPPLLGHPQQIVQALVNVLLNAAQASPPGSTIEIDVCLEGTEVAVRVTDHGSGMSPEVRAHLFEPFFTTKPGGEGTGLGLAIVRGVVASQGGSIAVDSELGCGSCFTLRLPVDQVLSRAA